MNLLDRLGATGNFLPDTQALINLPGPEGQRRGAGIVARLPGITGGEGLDQDDLPAPSLGAGLQGQGQASTYQASADARQLDPAHAASARAAAIRASLSTTVFGPPCLRL